MPTKALKSLAESVENASKRHVLVVCTGETCQHAGSGALLQELKRHCRHAVGDVRVSASHCIGHCQLAPAMVEDGRLLGLVSERRLRCELRRIGVLND